MTPTEAPFAKAIRALRKALGQTQEGMARRLGISLSGYRYWESGERTPRGRWLLRLRELCPDAETRAFFGRDIGSEGMQVSPPRATPPAAGGKMPWSKYKDDVIQAIEALYEKAASGDAAAQERLRRFWSKI